MTEADRDRLCPTCQPDVIVYGEVVPGFTLAYSPGGGHGLPPGHYGWFGSDPHEPWVAWPEAPVASAYDRHAAAAVDAWAEDDPRHEDEVRHLAAVEAIEPRFRMAPENGYALISACLAAGWDWQNSSQVMYWLVDRMARVIAAHEAGAR
jgi:hypothetical protein